ncbi:MAG: DNA-packaging protein [Bradyrhizobiaceae bacterium]|nr:DNA-packaging protein [Bradyrhizobiaceae bacterium]
MTSVEKFLSDWRASSSRTRARWAESLSWTEDEVARTWWELRARADQLPLPHAADGTPWSTWLFLGGRGAGKTRAGAEWVRGIVAGRAKFGAPARRIALVGETAQDAREVMIEGESGILRAYASFERPLWEPSRRRIVWKNGAVAYAFSADDPEQLRGPQFDAAWCDELCKWRRADAAFDMLQFGLRLGGARQVVTTTPRPLALLKRIMGDAHTLVTRATTGDNAFNLGPTFLGRITARYAGTRLGRQELNGEILEDLPGALFPRVLIERARIAPENVPPLARIVVAVDPPASSREGADACGIVAAGLGTDGCVYVLADDTAARLSPLEWARRAIRLYRKFEADRIVVEVNQGGEMARAVLAEADMTVPVAEVRATRGKHLRAEPVAALYEQGRVSHAGSFPALEDEMAEFGPDGLSSGRSPDRLDALVWAITELALSPQRTPRLRRL